VSKNPTVIAILTTLLFASTLGVLIAVAGFGVIRIGQEMMEGVGILPQRWGENNVAFLMELAAACSVPLVAWFSFWFYRKALHSERILTAQEAEARAAKSSTPV
jgi:hypothetical protein